MIHVAKPHEITLIVKQVSLFEQGSRDKHERGKGETGKMGGYFESNSSHQSRVKSGVGDCNRSAYEYEGQRVRVHGEDAPKKLDRYA